MLAMHRFVDVAVDAREVQCRLEEDTQLRSGCRVDQLRYGSYIRFQPVICVEKCCLVEVSAMFSFASQAWV